MQKDHNSALLDVANNRIAFWEQIASILVTALFHHLQFTIFKIHKNKNVYVLMYV